MSRRIKLDGRPAAQTETSRYPLPHIPLLTTENEIDVDALEGGDLDTYVNYDGIQEGDLIKVVWRGSDPHGEPFDDTGAITPVVNPDPRLGMRVDITNRVLAGAQGGWAFYSYQINNDEQNESARQFCYLGLRDRPIHQEGLGVVQVLESHDLVIDYSDLGSAGVTVYVPHYQAMQLGDEVTLVLNGSDEDGTPVRERSFDCSPQADDLGSALQCDIRRSELRDLVNGRAELHYLVKLNDASAPLQSPTQLFAVQEVPADEPRLPAMEIVGFSGDALDPDAFPSGLVIQARCPAQAMAGDLVLCHWSGGKVENRHILAVRLDASSLPDGLMRFNLDAKALAASVDDEVELFFQIAREGWALSSTPLLFRVQRARGPLAAPTVERTTPEANGAVGSASEFNNGAWVNIPAGVVQEGDSVKVYWEGDPYAGKVTVQAPDSPDAPLRFKIPAQYIAANMEQNDADSAKRFPVSYTLVTDSGELPSQATRLRILPVPRQNYQQLICHEADGLGQLSIGSLTQDPSLVLHNWPFMAAGNQVTIQVTGVRSSGDTYQKTLRDAQEVDATEVAQQRVVATVPLRDLRGLKINSSMTMKAVISFDGGKTTHAVPDSSVSIRA